MALFFSLIFAKTTINMPQGDKRRVTQNVQELDSLNLFRNITKQPLFIKFKDFVSKVGQSLINLGLFVQKAGDSMQGTLVMEDAAEIEFKRTDGNLAGAIGSDDPNQFGFYIAGIDNDDNLANIAVGGNNVYIGDNSIYFASNGTLPHGYLKLAGEPVLDSEGREFYPIQFQQIEQELYRETFTDNTSYDLSGGGEVLILNAGAVVNDYNDPADFSYSFRLQEASSNRSTEIEYWFEVNGVEGERFTTTVGSSTIVTVTGGSQIIEGINSGDLITLWAKALDTSQGRSTFIRGDDDPTTLILRQLGFGLSDGVSDASISGITAEYPQGEVMFRFTSTGTYSLQLISTYTETNFFINCKNLSGGDVTIQTSGSDEIYHSGGTTSSVTIGDGDNLKLYVSSAQYETI